MPAKNWSGREVLNLRHYAPKADALPGCATPRKDAAERGIGDIISNLARTRYQASDIARITNDPRAAASPRRAGHLQSVLRMRYRPSRLSPTMRSHPTGCRRGLSRRMLRAAQPPVASQSVRNSREMYLRGTSSSASAMPTRMIVKRISSAHFTCVMFR